MNLRYHKLLINGENYYRKYNGSFSELIGEEELMEILLSEAISEEVKLTDATVEIALNNILSDDSRQILEHYIMYLKHLAGID